MSLFKRSTTHAVVGIFLVAPVVFVLLDAFLGRIPAWIGMAVIILASAMCVQVEPVTAAGVSNQDVRPATVTSLDDEKERARRERKRGDRRDPAA